MSNLDWALSKPREVIVNFEFRGSSATFTRGQRAIASFVSTSYYYGGVEVLLDYVGLPRDFAIRGVIQHGVGHPHQIAEACFPTPFWNLKRVPAYLADKESEDYFRLKGFNTAKAIGSVWAYALENYFSTRKEQVKKNSNQMVIFLKRDGSFNLELLDQRIRRLAKLFPDSQLVFCVYWSEFLENDFSELIRRYNVRFTTLGISSTCPPSSQIPARVNFIYNLIKLLVQSDRVICDEYGSTLFYAASLGKSVKLSSLDLEYYRPSQDIFPWTKLEKRMRDWLAESVGNLDGEEISHRKLQLLSNKVIGFDNMLSREDLVKLFTA